MSDTGELDRRRHAFRPDLADSRLEGRVDAARFVDGVTHRVMVPSVPLRPEPRVDAPLDSELIRGEVVRVFDQNDDGWSWVQNRYDSYVGYMPTAALGPADTAPTHRVTALRTFVYPKPDMKLPAVAALSLGSLVTLGPMVETRGIFYRSLAGNEGAVVASHVAPVESWERDFTAVAEAFVRVPYLWGGRTSLGIDCSALVQLALMMAGRMAPRDTDMQAGTLGEDLVDGMDAGLRRGDLIFWSGHVGILTDPQHVVHASGHHMAVVREPLEAVISRMARSVGQPTTIRRVARSSE